MNVFTNYFPLFGGIFVIGLGLFVLSRNVRSRLNQLFFGFCSVVFFWMFGTFMMFLHGGTRELALFWDRFVYIGVVFMPVFMHHFSLVFTHAQKQKKLLTLGYALSFLFLILSRTPYFVDDLFYYQWGVHTRAQIGHHIFIILFYLESSLMFFNFYQFSKHQADAVQKIQTLYATIAFLSIILVGGTAYLPAYGIAVYPFSYLSGVFFAVVLGYAITKHKFLEIHLFIRKSGFYVLVGAMLLGVFGLVVWFGQRAVDSTHFLWTSFVRLAPTLNKWYFPISGLINFLASGLLGAFILLKNWRSKINRMFFALCFSIAIWSLGYFFWQISNTSTMALWWVRFFMIGAIFTAIFYLHLVIIFTERDSKKLHLALYFLYGLSFFWLLANLTGYFVGGVSQKLFFQFWPTPGPLYIYYIAQFAIQFLLADYLLFREYRISTGVRRRQLLFMLLGLAVAFLAGFTNFLLWYDIPVPPYPNILVSLFVIFTTYSVLKYRFLDIHPLIRKWLFYLLVTLLIVAMYVGTMVLLQLLGATNAAGQMVAAGVVAIIIGMLLAPRLERFFVENQLFLKTEYDHADALREMTRTIGSTLESRVLAEKISDIARRLLGVERSFLVLFDTNGHAGAILSLASFGFERNIGNDLAGAREKILAFFLGHREVVLVQELPHRIMQLPLTSRQRAGLVKSLEFYKRLGIEAVVPLYSAQHQLGGLLALGPKARRRLYTTQDIEWLEAVGVQLALAFENVKSYQKIKNQSDELEQAVEVATRELRATNTRQGNMMADIAHELQSPVSIIQGNWRSEQGGAVAPVPVMASAERLSHLIGSLLLLARADFGKLEIHREPFEFVSFIQEIIQQLQLLVQAGQLHLIVDLPPAPVLCNGDREKLTSVFTNLLSNAYKYTPPGGTVRLAVTPGASGRLTVDVENSGEPIPPEHIPHLFDRFYRVQGTNRRGTGLGLAIAKMVMDEHGGRLDLIKSDETGTLFRTEVPG